MYEVENMVSLILVDFVKEYVDSFICINCFDVFCFYSRGMKNEI